MDKKRFVKTAPQRELKGFEEFIDSQPDDTNFLPRPNVTKKEVSFENFTFLTNDTERLVRLKNLLTEKLPFAARHEQGDQIIKEQKLELEKLRKALFNLGDQSSSAYRRSLAEIFDPFFGPPKT